MNLKWFFFKYLVEIFCYMVTIKNIKKKEKMHFHALSDRSISHFSRINNEIRNSKLSFRWHELFYYSTRIVPFHFPFIYLLIFEYFLIAFRNENNQNPKRLFRSHNVVALFLHKSNGNKGWKRRKRKKIKESFRRRLVPQHRTRIIWLPIETIQRDMNVSIHIWVIPILFNYKLEFFIGRVARENYENYKYLFSDR